MPAFGDDSGRAQPVIKTEALRWTGQAAALAVIGIAVLVLIGWFVEIPSLTQIVPGWATMKVNSALGFLLSAISLFLLARRPEAGQNGQGPILAKMAAVLVFGIGFATALEYAARLDLRIDQLFFHDAVKASASYFPGRMSPFTAVNFSFIGMVLLLLAANWSRYLVQSITVCSAFLTLVVLTGRLYGLESLLENGHAAAVALHTNLSFCLLYIGIFCACGATGFMRLIMDAGAAGMIVRRLLPTAIIAPVVISWGCGVMVRRGFLGMELGLSIFTISTIVLFTALVWRCAEFLHQSEKETRDAEEKSKETLQRYAFLAEAMPQIVWMAKADGNVDYFNQRWYDYTGQGPGQSLNWGWEPVVHPEDLPIMVDKWKTALATGAAYEAEYRFKRGSDGTYRWHLGRAFPLHNDQGEIIQWVGTSTDIEDQKRVNVLLEKRVAERTADVFASQQKLQSVLDTATHVSIIATTPAGIITVFNHGAEQMLGYTADEVIGRESAALFHLESEVVERGKELTREFGRPITGFDVFTITARRGQSEEREWTYVRKDGATRTVNLVVTVSYDSKGEVSGFLGIAMDITERKKAEKLLRDQALILDLANDTIFVRDNDDRVTYWNDGAQRLYGWSRRQAIGHVTHSLLQTEFPEPLEKILQRLQADGHWEGELIHRQRNGTPIIVASSWTLQRDQAGRPVSVIEMNHDITARKHAEQELEKSRERLNAILFGALDGVIVYDAIRDRSGAIQDFRFAMINPSAEKLMGMPAKEVLGRTISEKFPDIREDSIFKKFKQIVESGFTVDFEYESKRAQTPRWYRIAGVKLGDGLVISYTEITARKEYEKKLKDAKEHAELADRAKSNFLANMSHEIRTPMNGVIGITGLLLDTNLDTEQRGLSETIRSSAESLLGLINDILDFSKIEAGKLSFEQLDFDLRKVVEDTLELLAGAAQAKGIELVGGVEPGMPSKLRGDPGRVHQVLTNLVSNAIKFTSQGEVGVRVMATEEGEGEVLVRFEIKDTGIGLDPAAVVQLFQPFTQADSSTSRKFGGTGLGLAICKRLAETMDGDIGVDSVPGQGSTFWVTMRFPSLTASADSTPSLNLANTRVLVVENNQTNRSYLHRQMVAWRLKDGCASTAAEALEKLHEGVAENAPYTLAIIDTQLPDVDGFELIRQINSDPALGATRLILITPFGKPIPSGELSNVKIAGSCAKPVRQSMLFDCIAHALGAGENVGAVRKTQSLKRIASAVRLRNERILLAEDNVVNQQVALGNLRKLGFVADMATNGLEVLEAVEAKRFDIILMDCQMPDLDGYKTTQEIRKREKSGHRTWIIAMTANVMVGDREKCLASGMDDYVSKPLRRAELRSALDRAVARSTTPALDEKVLRGMKEDDKEGLVMIIELFIDSAPTSIADLKTALEQKSASGLAHAAHTLKGSCSNLGATALREACAKLEATARAREVDGAAERVALIEKELHRAIEALQSFRKTQLTA